jgi:hypothetical protein
VVRAGPTDRIDASTVVLSFQFSVFSFQFSVFSFQFSVGNVPLAVEFETAARCCRAIRLVPPKRINTMQRGAAVKKQSRTLTQTNQADRRVRPGDLFVDAHATLMELAVATGLQVLQVMLEEDRTTLCGPRYRHQSGRAAGRAGTTASEVVLAGRKVAIRRPRVRRWSGNRLANSQRLGCRRSVDPARRGPDVG